MKDLVLQNVTIRYGDKVVLRDYSCVIPRGKTVFLSGPSGVGKTTLLRAIARLCPAEGSIQGNEGTFSAVFQEDRLLENLSGRENVEFVLPGEQLPLAEVLLEELGLDGHDPAPVRTYSGGMKRRVAIARALAAPHDCLLLDEPFKGLDEAVRERAAELIRRHEQGRTVILVSHDPAEAQLLEAKLELTLTPSA